MQDVCDAVITRAGGWRSGVGCSLWRCCRLSTWGAGGLDRIDSYASLVGGWSGCGATGAYEQQDQEESSCPVVVHMVLPSLLSKSYVEKTWKVEYKFRSYVEVLKG